MNRDEEFKAFEKACQDEHGFITDPFSVWTLAKAHAAEMAKQEVKVCSRGPGSYFLEWYDDTGEYHCRNLWLTLSREDAVKWANENGFRVVEE